jgi:hypothetical protein
MATRKPRTNGNGNGKAVTELKELEMIASPQNINQGFETILDTEPNILMEEALKLTKALHRMDLLERLQVLLPDVDVIDWHSIPVAYMPQLEEIQRSIEAQNSVRKLGSESSAQHFQVPVEAPEIPLIKDEPIPQPESRAIAPTEPSELAQGHAEQEAETLDLEALAEDLAQGGKLEAIQAGIQDADTLANDYQNAFRQQFAFRKAEMWSRFAQQQTVNRMQATNSNLTTPSKAAELRERLAKQQADFLKQDQAIKTAWENRSQPSK